MSDLTAAFAAAFGLLAGFDADLFEIVGRSLQVSLSAVLIAALIGLPMASSWSIRRVTRTSGRPTRCASSTG